MDGYERALDYANRYGYQVKEKEFKSHAKGLCKGNKIGINKKVNTFVEKRCVLVEEMAHCALTVGDILDTREPAAYKQEMYARRKAYEHLVPFDKLIEAYYRFEHDPHEIPEYLEVTPEVLSAALKHYSDKYGITKRHGKYTIYFLPLYICESSHIAM